MFMFCCVSQVVLTSVPDLQSGFSRELFSKWCKDPNNTIILTTRTTEGTLTRQLIENPKLSQVTLQVSAIPSPDEACGCLQPFFKNVAWLWETTMWEPGNHSSKLRL